MSPVFYVWILLVWRPDAHLSTYAYTTPPTCAASLRSFKRTHQGLYAECVKTPAYVKSGNPTL